MLAGAYVLIVLSVWERLRSNRWLRGLSGMGRMSLSHYLGQSFACGFLCYPYGLGWYAKISPAGIWLLAAVIFLLQGGFSWFWLKRFRVGPLEAVWRWGAGRYRALSQEIPPSTAVIPFIRSQQQEQS